LRGSTPIASSGAVQPHERGFTLIELTLVIVIGAILASVSGSYFFSQSVFSQRAYIEQLGSALRLAQKAAVASDCPCQVTISASSYSVALQAASGNTCNTTDTTWSTPVTGIDGQTVAGTAPAGVTTSPTGTIVFTGSGALSSYTATTWTVGSDTLTLDPVTGYVQVQ